MDQAVTGGASRSLPRWLKIALAVLLCLVLVGLLARWGTLIYNDYQAAKWERDEIARVEALKNRAIWVTDAKSLRAAMEMYYASGTEDEFIGFTMVGDPEEIVYVQVSPPGRKSPSVSQLVAYDYFRENYARLKPRIESDILAEYQELRQQLLPRLTEMHHHPERIVFNHFFKYDPDRRLPEITSANDLIAQSLETWIHLEKEENGASHVMVVYRSTWNLLFRVFALVYPEFKT